MNSHKLSNVPELINRIFDLELELSRKDVQIDILEFELEVLKDLDKKINYHNKHVFAG